MFAGPPESGRDKNPSILLGWRGKMNIHLSARRISLATMAVTVDSPGPFHDWRAPLAVVGSFAACVAAVIVVTLGIFGSNEAAEPDDMVSLPNLTAEFDDNFQQKKSKTEKERPAPALAILEKPAAPSPAKPRETPAPRAKVEIPMKSEVRDGVAPADPQRIASPEPEPPRRPAKERSRPERAGPPAEAKFIIPFDAVGPAEKLDRVKVVHVEGRFVFVNTTNVNAVTMTWEPTARFKCQEKAGGKDIAFLIAGSQGWFGYGRNTRPMEAEGYSFYENLAYSISLSNLIPLRQKGFDIVQEQEVQVRNRACSLVRVKAPGRPEMRMYFDKDTGLLAKSEFRGRFYDFKTLKLQKDATLLENYFADYRKAAGINHWRKYEQFRDGQKYCELNLDRVHFLDNVDDRWFSLDKSIPVPVGPVLGPMMGKRPAFNPKSPPGPPGPWQITGIIHDRKTAAPKGAPALRITVMFSNPLPQDAKESFRLVDRMGVRLGLAALRFPTSPGRYGMLAFESVSPAGNRPPGLEVLFLEDEHGNRAPLALGAASRRMR